LSQEAFVATLCLWKEARAGTRRSPRRDFPSRQRGAPRELVSAACGMHGPDDAHPTGDSSNFQTSYRDTVLSLLIRDLLPRFDMPDIAL
jgi:hypothetical protein